MGMNNGDTAAKTINLIISSSKLTAEVLKKAIQEYLNGSYTKRGKVSLNTLAKGGKIEGIEISNANIADFRRTAAKYDIQYALSKCPDTSTYYVMFSAAKAANIEKAFKEYASQKVRSNEKQDFCRETQKEFKNLAVKLEAERKKDVLSQSRKYEKVIER